MTFRRKLFIALLAVGVVLAGTPVSAAQAGPPSWRPAQHEDRRVHPKLSAALERRAGGDNEIVVQVNGRDRDAVRAAVETAGGTIRSTADGYSLARVSPHALGSLADDRRVDSVTEARRFEPVVTSQGVAQSGASVWQASGLTGAGVKVGIVDVGFTNYGTEQAAGRLSAPAGQFSLCSNGMNGSTNHGTAIAEIVHQMAPSAQLYLACVEFDTDLTIVEQHFAAIGVQIVNASITSNLSGRGDGTGAPGQAVRDGRLAGQLWSLAAGNDGDRHFNFNAVDNDRDGAVEFAAGPLSNGADEAELLRFSIPPNGTVDIQAKYDAWPTTRQELDVCLFTGAGAALGCEGGSQSEVASPPVTGYFQQGLPGGQYEIAIFRGPNTTFAGRVDVYFEGSEFNMSRRNASGSVGEPASSPYGMAVGAYQQGSTALEPFSSQGPTIDGRTKPDITAPDGVSNDIFNPFYGTSAATPHVTGAAALVKQAFPTSTAAQLQSFLECRAIDAGPPGRDNQFGAGLLSVGAPPGASSAGLDKPAVIRGTTIFEKNSLCSGVADASLNYGQPGDITILCDWDGNGTKTPGTFRNGLWLIRNAPGNGPADQPAFTLGDPGDVPVCGHWSTTTPGRIETAGVYRRGVFYLKFANTTGFADTAFGYGDPGDFPVTGDWNGDGITTAGVFRNGTWFLRNANGGGFADLPAIHYGDPGDFPVVGDWDGNGTTTMGVFRNGTWFLRNDNSGGFSTIPTFQLGNPGDRPYAWR
jgi:subtilisin family serine protease